jgi:hypothetical protein
MRFPAGKIVGSDIMRAVPYGYDRESGPGRRSDEEALIRRPGDPGRRGAGFPADLSFDTPRRASL